MEYKFELFKNHTLMLYAYEGIENLGEVLLKAKE